MDDDLMRMLLHLEMLPVANLEREIHEVIATLLADAQSANTSQPAANAATS